MLNQSIFRIVIVAAIVVFIIAHVGMQDNIMLVPLTMAIQRDVIGIWKSYRILPSVIHTAPKLSQAVFQEACQENANAERVLFCLDPVPNEFPPRMIRTRIG